MNGSFDQWTSLFLLAAAQGIFLSILLWSAKSPDKKNLLLGSLVFLYSISLVDNVWYWSTYFRDFPHVLGISMVFPFLYGPLIYCYYKEALSKTLNFRNDWKHFLVPLVMFIYLSNYYFASGADKLAMLPNWYLNPINVLVIPISSVISLICYGILVLRQIRNYQDKTGSKILISRNWLTQIFLAFSLFVVVFVAFHVLIYLGESTVQSDYIIAFGSATFIYFIGYLGFTKSKLLNGIKVEETKYQSTTLTKAASQHLFEKTNRHLRETKVFTDSMLRLPGLAEQLSITPHQLSQVINEHSDGNFSEFINSYRIEEAKERMQADTRINLLAIDVGFNNKTSFHQAFKKFVGCSPSEYRVRKLSRTTLKMK